MACKRCGAQIVDNGGLLAGGQIGAAGHSANEMWPLLRGCICRRGQSVTFEATRDEKSAAICNARISVIGAGICNQGGTAGGAKLAQLTINRMMTTE